MIPVTFPDYGPIKNYCWRFVVDAMLSKNQLEDLTHCPLILRTPVERFTIIAPRIGVIKTESGIEWYHICRPRKMAGAIKSGQTTLKAPWLELQWTMGHFNPTYRHSCWQCYHRLTKAEALMVKAAILDIRT